MSKELSITLSRKSNKEERLEEIVYFQNGRNPSYEEWKKAYIELYGIEPDPVEFEINRGDWDYTR